MARSGRLRGHFWAGKTLENDRQRRLTSNCPCVILHLVSVGKLPGNGCPPGWDFFFYALVIRQGIARIRGSALLSTQHS
jgi:hypothetical protein